MKSLNITTTYTIFNHLDELPETIQKLMKQAVNARNQAYAPYSKFLVGAAILLDDDSIILGNNQENAAYPSGLCAERVAIFSAAANFPKAHFKALAISATALDKDLSEPVAPCGACRQAIAEYEFKQETPIAIYFMGKTGKIIKANSIKDLLPLAFDKSFL
ncbi:MAG: cytidine deaminase [Flavobacteriales bacterium CG_4_9_14_0_2_um_filter_35_242]|nr:cytidine deaminase [Zetaproteobacteria bacterium]NDK17910.1 cytidine deaminase [Flavobacteriales bacterium]OIO10510.1 MAG: cytidine deaminase [Flavobacteriaceae bacterium CG1_02_35_72]PIV16383.1 MAG: cytidine deaminase [Flavobacteriales bacterium CG03_land_8_20_14_0_80_35_15]PIX06240.1 MAG: cytidine deaminase [Flavobacteriales bacterium CG_4_8_14_3_um_filter_35_10]PJA05990.1 MAG: cytidine deaminase [Flavobacteriales bacterium CG_4_10_14_0_2_um_filter_35_18]PJC58752.1 MAG: cytidine deaminas